MKRKSPNPDGVGIQPYPHEHTVSIWMREAGYNKVFLCRYLGISFFRLHTALIKPHLYFTVNQLVLISGLIHKPFIDVFFAVFPCHLFKKEFKGKWFDNTGLSVEFIPDPPEQV